MFDEKKLNELYRYSYALTNGADQAFDLVHETILSMNGKLIINKVAYAKKSIRNKFYNMHKRDSKSTGLQGHNLNHESKIDWEEIIISRNELKARLSIIKPNDRELLYNIFVEEYTYKEVARNEKVPIGTILARVHRLKIFFQEEEVK